ncbi:hypothetical protein PG985_003029 [Apiospora marii]|uniref:Serine hydrolase domain-containing protein n=1 Tax=Apiospora marii TaxID=335849 RepID=A0ABR1RVN6_9PEZI
MFSRVPLVPPGIESISAPGHGFYAFFDPKDLATLQKAIDQLDSYVSSEGPFDGVIGFSAGAVTAAMYMLQKEQQSARCPFQCAVFFSAAESRAEASYLGIDDTHPLISVPTAHFWGLQDSTAPSGGEDLSKMCDPTRRLAFIHGGGHEVPRGQQLAEAVHIIQETIRRAGAMGPVLPPTSDGPKYDSS